jgi:integrase
MTLPGHAPPGADPQSTAVNFLLRMICQILDHSVEFEWRQANPARLVNPYRVSEGGFHSSTEDEIERIYMAHPPGTTAHVAMTLMLWSGASRSDAVKLSCGNIQGNRLVYRRIKTRKRSNVVINIPINPELAAVLETLPRDIFTFLQTRSGKSRSPNGLGNKMREWCNAADLPECTSHGLR